MIKHIDVPYYPKQTPSYSSQMTGEEVDFRHSRKYLRLMPTPYMRPDPLLR